jgi:hypothetical protein
MYYIIKGSYRVTLRICAWACLYRGQKVGGGKCDYGGGVSGQGIGDEGALGFHTGVVILQNAPDEILHARVESRHIRCALAVVGVALSGALLEAAPTKVEKLVHIYTYNFQK